MFDTADVAQIARTAFYTDETTGTVADRLYPGNTDAALAAAKLNTEFTLDRADVEPMRRIIVNRYRDAADAQALMRLAYAEDAFGTDPALVSINYSRMSMATSLAERVGGYSWESAVTLAGDVFAVLAEVKGEVIASRIADQREEVPAPAPAPDPVRQPFPPLLFTRLNMADDISRCFAEGNEWAARAYASFANRLMLGKCGENPVYGAVWWEPLPALPEHASA